MSKGDNRREEIVSFMERYAEEHGGQSPSLQEIADDVGISKAAVDQHMQKLIDEGRACRRDGKLWLTQTPLFPLLDLNRHEGSSNGGGSRRG